MREYIARERITLTTGPHRWKNWRRMRRSRRPVRTFELRTPEVVGSTNRAARLHGVSAPLPAELPARGRAYTVAANGRPVRCSLGAAFPWYWCRSACHWMSFGDARSGSPGRRSWPAPRCCSRRPAGYWMSRRALAPVEQIASTASQIQAQTLEQYLTEHVGSLDTTSPDLWAVYTAGLDELYAAAPSLDGVLVRIGEAGRVYDVDGWDYYSSLAVTTVDAVRAMLTALTGQATHRSRRHLPLLERRGRGRRRHAHQPAVVRRGARRHRLACPGGLDEVHVGADDVSVVARLVVLCLRLVPTNRMRFPDAKVRDERGSFLKELERLLQVNDEIPLRFPKMYFFIFGFQRLV